MYGAEYGAEDWEYGAEDWEYGAEDWEYGAEDWEYGAEDWENGAEDWEYGAEDSNGADDVRSTVSSTVARSFTGEPNVGESGGVSSNSSR